MSNASKQQVDRSNALAQALRCAVDRHERGILDVDVYHVARWLGTEPMLRCTFVTPDGVLHRLQSTDPDHRALYAHAVLQVFHLPFVVNGAQCAFVGRSTLLEEYATVVVLESSVDRLVREAVARAQERAR